MTPRCSRSTESSAVGLWHARMRRRATRGRSADISGKRATSSTRRWAILHLPTPIRRSEITRHCELPFARASSRSSWNTEAHPPTGRMKERIAHIVAIAMLEGTPSLAQPLPPVSDTDISKEIENPVSRRITLPLRYEADFLDGPYKATKETFSIDQAVVPFRLNEDWALITRTKLPAIVQPPKKLGESWAFGLSNGYTTFFLSPAHAEGFYWGVGPVFIIRRRRTRQASTNGAPARRPPLSSRTKARGCLARSSIISGRLAARLATATAPTSYC